MTRSEALTTFTVSAMPELRNSKTVFCRCASASISESEQTREEMPLVNNDFSDNFSFGGFKSEVQRVDETLALIAQ